MGVTNCSLFPNSEKRGFALAEAVVALFIVTAAIGLIAGLGQQVLDLAKKSKQTAAAVELRSKTTAITRNLESWLGKLRSSTLSGSTFAACIPDPSAVSSIFACPDVDDEILNNDAELKRIAGTQLHASSTILVDMLGEKLAGTESAPVLYDIDGRICDRNCAFKATGYMLRSNASTDLNPGNVRFVVKFENIDVTHGTPLRSQYLTIDVGSEWQQATGFCPSGSIKVGYLSNGKANCINPTKKCATGTIHLGLNSNGDPICKAPPASCALTGGSVVINATGDDLVCASNTTDIPCEANQIFLGYYAGTGVPMCSGTNLSCPTGQVQIGIKQDGENLAAQCEALPSCKDSQKLSYDGSQFVCQSASVASLCGSGEVVVGINEDGSAKCEPLERNLASTDLNCPSGQYVSGLDSDGSVKCEDLPLGGDSTLSNPQIPQWESVPLSDTNDFDSKCEYRFKVNAKSTSIPEIDEETYFVANMINKKAIGQNSFVSYVIKANKKSDLWGLWNQNDTSVNLTSAWGRNVIALEKRCSEVSTSGNSSTTATAPSTPVAPVQPVQISCTTSMATGHTCSATCPSGSKFVAAPYIISGLLQWNPRVAQNDEKTFSCYSACGGRSCVSTTCGAVCAP